MGALCAGDAAEASEAGLALLALRGGLSPYPPDGGVWCSRLLCLLVASIVRRVTQAAAHLGSDGDGRACVWSVRRSASMAWPGGGAKACQSELSGSGQGGRRLPEEAGTERVDAARRPRSTSCLSVGLRPLQRAEQQR